MSFIVENENYAFWVTRRQFGLVVAAMSIGAMCASLPAGLMRHRFGTKRTILIFALPSTLGSILITMPQNLPMVRTFTFLKI
jgi:MFS family permease